MQGLKAQSQVSAGAALRLQQQQVEHLRLHKLVYGTSHLRPKRRYQFHFKGQLLRDQMLLDMFVHDRRHTLLKRIGDAACLGNGFELQSCREPCKMT
jgi:hypothetical protein